MGEPTANRMLGMYPRGIRLAVANPLIGLRELDRDAAEGSLLKYIEMMWPVIEPARPFIKGKPIEVICEHLEAVSKGQIKNLLMNVPPGCMKSLATNVFWPSWEWGPRRRPDLRFLSWSYAQDLTVRDNRRCRQIIDSPEYQLNWGDVYQIASDQDAKVKYETTARGWKIATSVGGVSTGERGDRLVIDDPHNVKEAESEKVRESTLQWFTEVLPTRFNDANSAIVIIMQRVHERDVSGLILAEELDYEYLCLPMEYDLDHPFKSKSSLHFVDWRTKEGELLWPDRFSEKQVGDLKKALRAWGGTYAEAGQLQQRPSARGGGKFRKKWWRFFETAATGYHLTRDAEWNQESAIELPKSFDWMLISVDASFKKTLKGSRVSIGCIAGVGPKRFVLDNFTKRMSFNETCQALLKVDPKTGMILPCMIQKWPRADKILIEEAANGAAIINTMSESISGVIAVRPEGGKESRAEAMLPGVESGCWYLPEGAPWLKDFIDEFGSFPVGATDDQVDMCSQVHNYMTTDQDVLRAIQMAKM